MLLCTMSFKQIKALQLQSKYIYIYLYTIHISMYMLMEELYVILHKMKIKYLQKNIKLFKYYRK